MVSRARCGLERALAVSIVGLGLLLLCLLACSVDTALSSIAESTGFPAALSQFN